MKGTHTMITKTFGKLHFTDLDPGRFEMMSMLMVYRMRRWEKINHYGATGNDDGIDIEAVELLDNGKRVTHHFQCKRYTKLTKAQLEKIIKDYRDKNHKLADYYYLVCGCDVSKTASDRFDTICDEIGLVNHTIWTASYIEAALFSDYHDILFAFFGVEMAGERNNTVAAIRRNVALKKRMQRELEKEHFTQEEIRSIQHGNYWKKFKHTEVLIRSIYDRSYPENPLDRPGYYKTEVYNWYHNGLEVRTSRCAVMAKVRFPKNGRQINSINPDDYEIQEIKLEEYGQIPYENIIEIDIDGDEYYRFPHLYCDYPCGSNPYEAVVYRFEDGYPVSADQIIELL